MKALARITAGASATLIALGLLWRLRELVAVLAVALILSGALHPVVSLLRRKLSLPRILAVLLVHLLAVGLLAGGVALLVGPLLTELTGLTEISLPAYASQLLAWQYRGGAWEELAKLLPSPHALSMSMTGLGLTSVVQGVVSFTGAVLDGVVAVLLVVVFSIAWSLEREAFARFVFLRVPARWRGRVRTMVTDLSTVVGFQFIGGLLKLLTIMVVLVPTYRIAGLSVPTLTATVVALCALLPLVGRPLALLAVLVLGIQVSTGLWVGLAVGTFVFLSALDLGMPRLLRTRQDHAFTAVVLILVLAKLVGWVGLLMAPLLAPMVHEVGAFLLDLRQDAATDVRIERAQLEERLVALEARATVARKNRRALSLIRRLRLLLDESTSLG